MIRKNEREEDVFANYIVGNLKSTLTKEGVIGAFGQFMFDAYEKDNNINIDELEDKLKELQKGKNKSEAEELDAIIEKHLEIIDIKTEEKYKDVIENFPVMNLYAFLIEESTNPKPTTLSPSNWVMPEYLFQAGSTVQKSELSEYFTYLINDKNLKLKPRGIESVKQEISKFLIKTFKGLRIISNKRKLFLDLNELLRDFSREGSPTDLILRNAKNKLNVEFDIKDTTVDSQLNDMLSYFKSGATKFNDINELMEMDNPPLSSLRFIKEVTDEQLEDWKGLITSEFSGANLRKIRPFLTLIDNLLSPNASKKRRINTSSISIDFEADKFIGSLDLKKTNRRETIYKYWRDVSRDYSALHASIQEFQNTYKDVIKSDQYKTIKKDKLEHAKAIAEFDIGVVKAGAKGKGKVRLQYIIPVNPVIIRRQNPNDALVQVIEGVDIFSESGGGKKGSNFQRIYEKEIDGGNTENKELSSEESFEQDAKTDSSNVRENVDEVDASSQAGDYQERFATGDSGGFGGDNSEAIDPNNPVNTYTKDGDYAGLSAEVEMAGGAAGMKREIQQLDTFGRVTSELINDKVDPLFAYAFDRDGDSFKNLKLFKKEIKEAEKTLKMLGSLGRSQKIDFNFDEKLTTYIKDLHKQVISTKYQTFHLPISTELSTLLDGDTITYNEAVERKEHISKFLTLIARIIDFGETDLEQSGSGAQINISAEGESKKPSLNLKTIGRKNKKTMLNDLFEAKDAFDKMLENIINYYIVPFNSGKTPFDYRGGNSLVPPKIAEKLGRSKNKSDPFFKLLSLRLVGVSSLFPTKSYKVLVDITNLLNLITTPAIFTSKNKLRKTLQSLKQDLKIILGKSFVSDIEAELGAYYYSILSRKQIGDDKIFGKNVKDFANVSKEYNKSSYPLQALILILRLNIETIKEDRLTNISVDGDKKSKKDIVDEFKEAVEKFSNTIIKSDVEIKILDAHDNIRKMLNKPVYYKYGDIQDYSHINSAKDILKSHFNVDISAVDIENIVMEIDSMANLGLKYGMPSESVYFLKANFR
tara:strand:+ start:5128 stop:8250 length:3123 start_codon:yes stop_codon:yes gene_type:complete